jgi:ectoine hydroxylase-related dioxygenase (phytanoyl-CoA dioxygenase family)
MISIPFLPHSLDLRRYLLYSTFFFVDKACSDLAHFLFFLHQMKELSAALQVNDPKIVQSMYICKQPKIGGKVVPHQDGTFLYTEPMTTIGFWVALEDCSTTNGCLWAWPGSHKGKAEKKERKKEKK